MTSSTRSFLKKRKQPSLSSSTSKNDNPVTGTSTSGKAQKFVNVTHLYAVDKKYYVDDDDEIYHIPIKDIRARRVFSKPPKLNDVDKVRGDLAGKNENPRSDCGLIDGKLNESDCKGSDVEIKTPNLLEKCVYYKEGLKEENPDVVCISEMCDDSRFNCEEKEGLIGRKPNLGISEMSDDFRVIFEEKEGLIGENTNLSILEMCDDSRVCCEENDLIGGNPNLGISKMSDEFRVTCEEKDLIGGNLNLDISAMSDDSRVNCEEKGLIGENPNLGISEISDDSRINCEQKGLIEGNPNLSMSDSKVNCEVDGLIDENPNLSMCNYRVDFKDESLNGAKGDREGLVSNDMSPNLSSKVLQCRRVKHSEENVQTTPPEAVVLIRRERFDQSVLQNKSVELRSPPMEISPSKGGSSEGKKKFSNPRRNLGLNPCSRLKVFKAPNSLSYRRMLPFLMDLTKDEPSTPESNPIIKIETDIEPKPQVSPFLESIFDNHRLDEKPRDLVVCSPNTGTKEEDKLLLRPKTSDSSAEQTTPCSRVNCPLGKSSETPISDDSHYGTPIKKPRTTGESSANGGFVSLDTDLTVSPINPETNTELSVANATLVTPSAKIECRAPYLDSKPEESSVSVVHSSSKLKAGVSSGVPGFGLARGILKRNPRGCRGICHCLNCASFRLNAEKAFEFSRNQWLEVEELAMDLINEFSSLRSVLEKSVNGVNDNAVVPVDQVQDICKRASSAEDIARSRLSQMSEDLHVHRRIKVCYGER